MSSFQATVAHDGRTKVAVISHERSGTHFLMNTLAANYGYVSQPWWNLDFTLGLNFHSAEHLASYFGQAKGQSVLNIVKSHHQAGFFEPFIRDFTDDFQVFYICREPRAVIASFSKLINELPWNEGPNVDSPAELLRAEPSHALLRYQQHQAPTMLHRWADHVTGWVDLSDRLGENRIHVVRYEDLAHNFEATVANLGDTLGLPCPETPTMPSRTQNVIGTGRGTRTPVEQLFSAEDHAFIEDTVAPLLDRFGWGQQVTKAAS